MHSLMASLDEEQTRAVLAPVGPVRIVAGAGAGKTRTVTARIAYQHHANTMPGQHVLALTHSTKAAHELGARLTQLGVGGVAARTFHSAALRQLRHFWSATGKPGTGPKLLSDQSSAIRVAIATVLRTAPATVTAAMIEDITRQVAWAHAHLLTPAEYPVYATQHGVAEADRVELFADIFARYEQNKTDAGVLDYDDLLTWCWHLLHTRPYVAATVRDGYRSFVVDEYQDTDLAQHRLLRAWVADRDAVCVVGDPQQSIYGFKGADAALMGQFCDWFPHASTYRLRTTYRCGPAVCDHANRLGQHTLADLPALAHLTSPLLPHRAPTSGQVTDTPHVLRRVAADEAAEHALVAETIRRWTRSGTALSQVAVLTRTRAQARSWREVLARYDIPVATSVSEHRTSSDPTSVSRRGLVALVEGWTAEPDIDPVALAEEVLDGLGYDPHYEPQPDPRTGAAAMGGRRSDARAAKHAALGRILDEVRDLVASGYDTTDLVEEYSDTLTRTGSVGNGVAVMTIHAAKGLEWDACVIANMNAGQFPPTNPSPRRTTDDRHHDDRADLAGDAGDASDAEETRLLYVGLTRARRHILLTAAGNRRLSPLWSLLA